MCKKLVARSVGDCIELGAMSAAVCVAVAGLAWLAGAAEYVDYSGARMPLFEGGEYEAARNPQPQPPHETTETSYILKEDSVGRPRSNKKPSHQLQPVDDEDDVIDIFDKYKYEEPHSFKPSVSYAKRRPARIGYQPREEPTAPPRAAARRGRPWAGAGGDEYYEHADSDQIERDRNSRVRMLDDEGYRAPRRKNGNGRRKPRARGGRNHPEDVVDDDDDEVARRRSKGDDAEDYDRREETGEADDEGQRWRGGEAQDEEAAEDESTRPPPPPPPPPARTRAPPYHEYYDMQRVKSIQNKLPALKRRTQARPGEAATPRRAPGGGAWGPPHRPPAAFAQRLPDTPGNSPGSAGIASTPPPSPTLAPSTERTDPEELSIAEKSRLSILKKAQRKESVDSEAASAKPPVLLQVTQRLQTVVMVEGGRRGGVGGGGGGGGARLVAQDSPERLAKVRRLMRHKLIAGARSVQDLTDNWDELVCDYFDVRALDSAAPGRPAHPLVLLLCFCATSTKFILTLTC